MIHGIKVHSADNLLASTGEMTLLVDTYNTEGANHVQLLSTEASACKMQTPSVNSNSVTMPASQFKSIICKFQGDADVRTVKLDSAVHLPPGEATSGNARHLRWLQEEE